MPDSEPIHLDEQSTGPLTKRWAPSSAFQQQGQVDWVELSAKTISFSFNLLSRMSSAGVDPYTLTVGYAMANTLVLGQAGRRNIELTITNLKCFRGISEALWFGFGLKSLPRMMATTEQGATCMALCAALTENYHQDFAAEILHEYIKLCRIPMTLTPAISEWRALLHACAGMLATTQFPTQLGNLMRIERVPFHVNNSAEHSHVYRYPATQKSIAEALLLIADVSRGTLASIVITGGSDTAWLAALAEWLLNLTLIIKTDINQEIYSNCPIDQDPHILFIYKSVRTGETSSQLELVSKTHRLIKAEAGKCIIHMESMLPTPAVSGGRFKWDNCLSSTFAIDFEKLMVHSMTLGSVIGSAARIFSGVANADFEDTDLMFPLLRCWQFYSKESHGKGFVQTMVQRFPELSQTKREMDRAVRATFQDAKLNYESKLALIRNACLCQFCVDNFKPQTKGPLHERYCLVIIIETIIALCQSLSEMNIAENLFPVRTGIEDFYLRHLISRRRLFHRDQAWANPATHYVDNDESLLAARSETRLLEAANLFTGRNQKPKQNFTAALSSGGICVYFDILRELTDTREQAWRVNVIPGRIEHGEKIYHAIEDDSDINSLQPCRRDDQQLSLVWDDYPKIPPPERWSQYTKVSVLFKETASALIVTYELHDGKGGRIPMIPARLAEKMITDGGLIACGKENCSKRSADDSQSSEVFRKINYHGFQVILSSGNFLLALSLASRIWDGSHTILRDGECIACSLKAAMNVHDYSGSSDRPQFWIISK